MAEDEISEIIVNTAFHIHVNPAPGLFESVYEEILSCELRGLNLIVSRQQAIPVFYKDIRMERGFKADLIINNKVLIEIKSVKALSDIHKKQTLTYLRLTGLKLGILINFNEVLIKNGIKRIVNDL